MYLPKQSIPVQRNTSSSKYQHASGVEAQLYEITDCDRFECQCSTPGFPNNISVDANCICRDVYGKTPSHVN